MKKGNFKLLPLILVLVLMLSACSSGDSKANGSNTVDNDGGIQTAETIKDLVIPKLQTRELETFNVLYSQRAEDFENLTNLFDPLLEVDTYGELVPGIAEEWGT
ncbi:MAG: hypothetical protein AB2375_06890, partial [Tissierellaceae bacterium]